MNSIDTLYQEIMDSDPSGDTTKRMVDAWRVTRETLEIMQKAGDGAMEIVGQQSEDIRQLLVEKALLAAELTMLRDRIAAIPLEAICELLTHSVGTDVEKWDAAADWIDSLMVPSCI